MRLLTGNIYLVFLTFPDPAIIGVNDQWYAFATRTLSGNVHIQIAESRDFETWNIINNEDGSQRDALPDLPSWVDGGNSNTASTSLSNISIHPS